MSESVIADFVAHFNSTKMNGDEPIKGRVVLSQKRLVLAVKDTDKLTIPLSAVHDIGVGQVPEELDGFFQTTVTLIFQDGNHGYVAAIEGDDEKILTFSELLFKAILNGMDVNIRHPARIGGRKVTEEFIPASVTLQPKSVKFTTESESIPVDLAAVAKITRNRREIHGLDRPILEIRHISNGQAILSMIATQSSRKMELLSRYLRLEYSKMVSEIGDISLSGDEKQLLVAVYSGAGEEGISLPSILNMEEEAVEEICKTLMEDDLLTETKSGLELTPKGQIVVNRHLEEVNV